MFQSALMKERQAKLDWPLLLAILALIVLGVVFIYSATMANESARVLPWYRQVFFMQILRCFVGVCGATVFCLIDYHLLARWSLVVYWGTILLLVAVLFAGSTHGWGARRWLDLGFFQVQPSEFAKLS